MSKKVVARLKQYAINSSTNISLTVLECKEDTHALLNEDSPSISLSELMNNSRHEIN